MARKNARKAALGTAFATAATLLLLSACEFSGTHPRGSVVVAQGWAALPPPRSASCSFDEIRALVVNSDNALVWNCPAQLNFYITAHSERAAPFTWADRFDSNISLMSFADNSPDSRMLIIGHSEDTNNTFFVETIDFSDQARSRSMIEIGPNFVMAQAMLFSAPEKEYDCVVFQVYVRRDLRDGFYVALSLSDIISGPAPLSLTYLQAKGASFERRLGSHVRGCTIDAKSSVRLAFYDLAKDSESSERIYFWSPPVRAGDFQSIRHDDLDPSHTIKVEEQGRPSNPSFQDTAFPVLATSQSATLIVRTEPHVVTMLQADGKLSAVTLPTEYTWQTYDPAARKGIAIGAPDSGAAAGSTIYRVNCSNEGCDVRPAARTPTALTDSPATYFTRNMGGCAHWMRLPMGTELRANQASDEYVQLENANAMFRIDC